MKKRSVFSLLIALLCLLCIVALAACDETPETPETPGEGSEGDHTHVFGEWKEIKASTCSEKGQRVRFCQCGERESEEIAIVAHEWGGWTETLSAKCNTAGSKNRTCKKCSAAETVTVAATGEHNCNTSNVCLDCNTTVSYTTVGIIYGENSTTNTAYVSSVDTDIPANIVLPHYYNGKPLTEIRSAVFQNKTALESIVLPTTLTTIGESAFSGCTNLKSVNIPTSVTEIGESAFSGCTNLKSVNIPTSVTEIGQDAFSGCDKVIQTENGLCYVDQWVVCTESVANGSNSEAELKLRADTVGIACFGCRWGSAPKKLHIPANVAYINEYAFCGQDFEQVTFADHSQLRVLGERAFYECSYLKSVDFGDNSQLIRIDSSAFKNCGSLAQVDFGDNSQLQTIGDFVFSADFLYCSNSLTTITIPASVTTIRECAFSTCPKLTSVIFEENSQLTSILSKAFANCPELTTLAIPPSVQTMASDAFEGCTKLIRIAGGISYVDKWVIDADSNITTAVLPADTVGIASGAFYGCRNLPSIAIPSSVTSIGSSAFSNCSSLTAVHITDLVAWCNIAFSTPEANPLFYAGNLYLNGTLVTALEIPNGITSIGNYAFYGCTGIASVTMPVGLTSIGSQAFRECTGLTSINIPDSVTSIGSSAFSYYHCDSLTTVYYGGNASDWSNISIGSSNSALTLATCYYYSATQPTVAGNWWYYDNDGKVAVWPAVEE